MAEKYVFELKKGSKMIPRQTNTIFFKTTQILKKNFNLT